MEDQAWYCRPFISVLRRLRQENYLDYIERTCLKKKYKNKTNLGRKGIIKIKFRYNFTPI